MPGEKHNFLVNIWCCYLVLFATLFRHVHADDAAVMQELAKGIRVSGWSGADNPCEWSGVQCDSSGKVTNIDLNSMSVTGRLAPDLNQLSSLKSLSLQRNQLSGPLPSLSNLTAIKDVYLDLNNFSSIPADFVSGLTSLRTFSISDNPNLPPWKIPTSLIDSTQLLSFSASRCNIIGPIPDIFGSFPSLQSLRLSYNKITGPLPPSFAKSGIQNLWLNNQEISGRIDVIGSMTQLSQVWLHVNNFSGSIPDLSGCKELYDLQLRDNQFTGVIPNSLPSLPSLKNVSLQNNHLQGPFPSFPKSVQVSVGSANSFCNTAPGPCDPQVTTLLQVASDFGYPIALAESWKGNDACANWEFITCQSGKVIGINFAKQNFRGTISPAIGNLTSLRTLTLSDNQLTGRIPSSLTSLPDLKLVDVSNNNISGQVPAFSPNVAVKTSGNPFIGMDLPSGSPPEGATPSSSTNVRKASSPWVIAVIVIVSAVIVFILGCIVYRRFGKNQGSRYKWRKSSRRKKSYKIDTNDVNNTGGGGVSQMGTYNSGSISGGIPIDVLREVTGNFSEENILGKGGFGTVYRGQLPDGTQIAVKRMLTIFMSPKGLNEFKAEIEVLSKVKHRNLVALIGFCVNGNERLLVYEFMPQGTLGDHLFSWQRKGIQQPLSWKQRVSIALDVARGVEYLHGMTEQSFIHRDLKPSNILLGDDMRAKVSDFGLVKHAPDEKKSIETRLAGTFGYLAPEYAATGRVTTKVDVFAFGVILMELITGRKAVDDEVPEEQCHLVTWFRKVIVNEEEDIRGFIDPWIEQDEETMRSIDKVVELAAHCTARDPHQRPIMGHAVNVLSPLVEQWTPGPPSPDDVTNSFAIDQHLSLPEILQRWKVGDEDSSSTYLLTNNPTGITTGSSGTTSENVNFSGQAKSRDSPKTVPL